MIRAVNASSPTSYGVIIASWLKSAFLSPFLCHLWQVRFPRKQVLKFFLGRTWTVMKLQQSPLPRLAGVLEHQMVLWRCPALRQWSCTFMPHPYPTNLNILPSRRKGDFGGGKSLGLLQILGEELNQEFPRVWGNDDLGSDRGIWLAYDNIYYPTRC